MKLLSFHYDSNNTHSLCSHCSPSVPNVITSVLFVESCWVYLSSEKYLLLALICSIASSFSSSRFSILREKVGCWNKLTLSPPDSWQEKSAGWGGKGPMHTNSSAFPWPLGLTSFLSLQAYSWLSFWSHNRSACVYALTCKWLLWCTARGLIWNSRFHSFLIISQLIILFTFLMQCFLSFFFF